ncbi:MAG: hypothetical protein H7325_03520 [Pedobacter sp.]|nr:hypothetical protein [Pedobacter sp.]
MSTSPERNAYVILKTDSSNSKGFEDYNFFTGNYQMMNNGAIKFSNFAPRKKSLPLSNAEAQIFESAKICFKVLKQSKTACG